MLTMKDLDLVRSVADSGSLTAAAKQMHVTQSAASQRLANLHARLNMKLFDRRDGIMQPTTAGRRVLAAANVIVDELRSALVDIKELAEHQDGQLRIATQCYTCYRWLPFVIRAMREDHPLLSVDVVPEATDNIYDAVRDRQLDVGIVSNAIADSDCSEYELFSDELFAVMHTDHELATEKYIAATQFSGQTLILYTGDRHAIVDEILAPANITDYKLIQVRITEAIVELVRSGQGIAIIAGWALDDIVETEDLCAVRITKSGFKRNWTAVVGEDSNDVHVDSFVRAVRSVGTAIEGRAWRKQLRQEYP